MTTTKLQSILGYLNLGLAVAHANGVELGHFGSTDFLALAGEINSIFLQAVTPAVQATKQQETLTTVTNVGKLQTVASLVK